MQKTDVFFYQDEINWDFHLFLLSQRNCPKSANPYRLLELWDRNGSSFGLLEVGQSMTKVNGILDFVRRSFGSKLKELILSLCSVLVCSHLECWVQIWASQYTEDMELLPVKSH